MLFSEILEDPYLKPTDFKDFEVLSVETDSRIVNPDSIFVALDGKTNRGVDFADQAIKNGARAIVVDEKYNYKNDHTIVVAVRDPRKKLVELLKKFFRNEFPKNIIGVTGTQGKTSVVEFIRQIMTRLGYSCASIGTLGLKYMEENVKENSLTMMEIVDLYRTLNLLKKKGVDFVSMEVTSQGLDTGRFDGMRVQVAAVTNICNYEHLDYHGTIENYFACKMRLLQEYCTERATAVLNPDSDFYSTMESICRERNHRILTFGYAKSAQMRILSNVTVNNTQRVEFEAFGKRYSTDTRLFGNFQTLNLLGALACVYGLGLDSSMDDIVATLRHVEAAEGRMKFVAKTKKGGRIYIDYAHTPSSYETVLGIIREHLKELGNGRLICLFGAGGDRDRSKRPLMGKIAQELSDIAIVTDDNPRTEDPEKIREDILSGCDRSGNRVYNFADGREEAIKFAISLLEENDILAILGKGHETYQLTRGGKSYFSETEIVLGNIN
ncbi:MAG: UDP-N-acetylmuramoyl-L-alanyl-D-glutamate--2,6-diaminopimelate ligase [Rickettsiales bacterium]|jgi:UDP-N-acetylmuramoyl-L-alanyl-D-glutamate--2,6-diaminopimelate ligase|nr:UDP-N-acetylmuramoyl-L-alanyl-D-glutamate--2,6-diaminopimelate ligase [Rickettsiales bacterium]